MVTPTLQFLGAAGTVTGSKFLVRDGDVQVLIDAGLFQGLRELRRRNWDPVDIPVPQVDAVVLTHAHLDHCGYLPALAKQGLDAPILATASTIALAEIVLRDSAKLQEEDAAYAAKKGFSKHAKPEPLYDLRDVERVLPMFRPVQFGDRVEIAPGAFLTLQPAGHILGSSTALLEMGGRRLVFSGDLGRPGHPLLVTPPAPPAADVVVMESTYGDRFHPPTTDEELADVVVRTIGRGGVVLIPAFAVDRTEVVLMALKRLVAAGRIPSVPVYVDSPMALRALKVYQAGVDAHEPDVRPDLTFDERVFDPGDLREISSPQESMSINQPDHPCIIISASGMATGGRIVHHLKFLLPNPRNTVVLVGYQAVGTRGRDLAEGAQQLKMHGQYVRVKAEVVTVQGLSVHADADELMAWVGSMPSPPSVVYVVHGEPAASAALAHRIGTELEWLAVVARDEEIVDLDSA
jgi:metallo-beta-lactamase family protein